MDHRLGDVEASIVDAEQTAPVSALFSCLLGGDAVLFIATIAIATKHSR